MYKKKMEQYTEITNNFASQMNQFSRNMQQHVTYGMA